MSTATLELLDAPVEVKADEERGRGFFAALVSVFGNTDRNGDRVLAGAFKRWIGEKIAAGKPIPVIAGHDHGGIPGSIIGSIAPSDLRETKDGLVVAGQLDIETNPVAADVFDKLKRGLIDAWSFAFETRDSEMVDGVRELKDVEVFEIGPVLVGANPSARTLALKSVEVEEKSPPWHVERRGGEFCVILDEDGSTVKCHPTEAEAVAHMRALYANAKAVDLTTDPPVENKRGKRISRTTAEKLAAIRGDLERHLASLDELLADNEEVVPVTKADLARQEQATIATFLAERGIG